MHPKRYAILTPLLLLVLCFWYKEIVNSRIPSMPVLAHRFSYHLSVDSRPRVLFYVFPQWHSIPENNRIHSWDFTDWKLIKSILERPQQSSNLQIPGELGWYNQLSYDLRKRQVDLLQQYGGYGFIYHVYWFTDHPVMDEPMRQLLADKDIKIPFIVNWANENWSRRWANGNGEILLSIDISKEENRRKFFNYLLPFFRDERYIRVEGKPVFQVYVADANMDLIFADFKRWSVEAGLLGLHCHQVLGHAHWTSVYPDTIHKIRIPVSSLADGVTEFQPNFIKLWTPDHHLQTVTIGRHHPIYHWRGVHVDWDNRPRYNTSDSVRAHPFMFEQHLRVVLRTMEAEIKNYSLSWSDQYITVNGWNEWSEGNTVEPSNIYGRGYLEALEIVMTKSIQTNKLCIVIAGSERQESYEKFANTIRSIQTNLPDMNWEALIILNDPTPHVPVNMMEFIRHFGDARVRMIDIPIYLQQENATDHHVLSYVIPHCHDVRKSHYVALLNEGEKLTREPSLPVDWESTWKIFTDQIFEGIESRRGERIWKLETNRRAMKNFTATWNRKGKTNATL